MAHSGFMPALWYRRAVFQIWHKRRYVVQSQIRNWQCVDPNNKNIRISVDVDPRNSRRHDACQFKNHLIVFRLRLFHIRNKFLLNTSEKGEAAMKRKTGVKSGAGPRMDDNG